MEYTLILNLIPEALNQLSAYLHQNYPNYTILTYDSKVMSLKSVDENLPPDAILYICDSQSSIQELCKQDLHLPVIAWSHQWNQGEDLSECRWLFLSLDAFTEDNFQEVYYHFHHLPMPILETTRTILRELSPQDLRNLLLMQAENVVNPDGCFFRPDLFPDQFQESPESPEDLIKECRTYLEEYIRNQYPFYGFGLYAIISKRTEQFVGLAGFSQDDVIDDHLPIGYTLLRKHQGKGNAKEIVTALTRYAIEDCDMKGCYARIYKKNTTSRDFILSCGYHFYGMDPSGEYELYFS